MAQLSLVILLLSIATVTHSTIITDFTCTTDTNAASTYLNSAAGCEDLMDNCELWLTMNSPESAQSPLIFPTPGASTPRPSYCYSVTGPNGPVDPYLRDFARQACPKSCGYCCETPDYTACLNRPVPTIDCSILTPAMCHEPTWHAFILTQCPASCGLCGEIVCFDKIPSCYPAICQSNPVYASKNCKKTCGYCSDTSTPAAVTVAGRKKREAVPEPEPCDYLPDAHENCQFWADNGFCRSSSNKANIKRYCATTCKVC